MKIRIIALAALAAVLVSCGGRKDPTAAAHFDASAKAEPVTVVPYPNDITVGTGAYDLAGTAVSIGKAIDEASAKVIRDFVARLETVTGEKTVETEGGLAFIVNENMAPEEYALIVDSTGVKVEAAALGGFLYATETMKQLLPPEIYGNAKTDVKMLLPAVKIFDAPRFAYRGMHLDTCRHFWSVAEVKKYLDVMAMFKINRFHFHLTEDQGWRMEIKRYPRLTEVGGWRNGTMIGKDWGSNDGIRYGGFYTQDELRDIVAYAAALNITVIPEIDLPGHMLAALTAYPELGCTGGPYEVWTRWGVSNEILCAGNDAVFDFLEGVLTEVMDVFPSEYIHIGGDECFIGDSDPWNSCPKCLAREDELGIPHGPMAKHYLQNYVTERVQTFLGEHGRKIIGWDEILQGELAPGATVMSWRGVEGGIEAAEKGFDAIMTPSSFLYFDYYQSRERDKEPICIGGNLPIENVYAYEPFDGLKPGTEDHILGVQANLWTEYIATPEHLEYMLLPRMCALSEIQWCEADRKDYDRFNGSLDRIFRALDILGYTSCRNVRGEIGLDRVPARSEEELQEYLNNNPIGW